MHRTEAVCGVCGKPSDAGEFGGLTPFGPDAALLCFGCIPGELVEDDATRGAVIAQSVLWRYGPAVPVAEIGELLDDILARTEQAERRRIAGLFTERDVDALRLESRRRRNRAYATEWASLADRLASLL